MMQFIEEKKTKRSNSIIRHLSFVVLILSRGS